MPFPVDNNYVKIIRFDNRGFDCKPYSSSTFPHGLEFINAEEVVDLNHINLTIERSDLIKPIFNDLNWSGCFCFLDEYDSNIFSQSGVLGMKRSHNKNIAYLHRDTKIWVRNRNHQEDRIYKYFTYQVEHDGKRTVFTESTCVSDGFRWVKMTVGLALERTMLWKQSNSFVPEWLTEFYLLEHQAKELLYIDKQKDPEANARIKFSERLKRRIKLTSSN